MMLHDVPALLARSEPIDKGAGAAALVSFVYSVKGGPAGLAKLFVIVAGNRPPHYVCIPPIPFVTGKIDRNNGSQAATN